MPPLLQTQSLPSGPSAAPLGPPPVSAATVRAPSGAMRVMRPAAISQTSTSPPGRATGPSGKRSPLAISLSSVMSRSRLPSPILAARNRKERPHGRKPDHPFQRVPARLPFDLRARGRTLRRPQHRARPGRPRQRLYRRRGLRQGRALRRAHPPSGPAAPPDGPHRPQGLGQVRADFLGRRSRPLRGEVPGGRGEVRAGDRLALLLCRHDGPGAARRHQPAPPRQALFRLPRHDLHHARLERLHRRHGQARRLRPARDGEGRPAGDLGHQRRRHPGECDDPCGPRPQGARRAASS